MLGHGEWPHGQAWLHEAAAECYIPLLRMMDRLAADGRSPRITIGLTPILAEMLTSRRFQKDFAAYLDAQVSKAERDHGEFAALGDKVQARLAETWATFYEDVRRDFDETYRQDIVGALRRLQTDGHIEVTTSAATHGYLPLLGRDEAVDAQIRAGVATYRRHFGMAPRGIWLPECAYRPAYEWSRPVGPPRRFARKGLESSLSRSGLRYFFVDTHLVAGGATLGTYGDRIEGPPPGEPRPATGLSIYEAYAVLDRASRRRVVVLARDPKSSVQVWSADYGYPGDGAYLEFHRKKGPGGLRYWRITDRRLPLDDKIVYDPSAAAARVRAHADHFLRTVRETLSRHWNETGRAGVVVAPFDAELFGHWWFEGPNWLEAVLRGLGEDVTAVTASEFLLQHPPGSVIALPEGSWGQGGHHWVWLNENTRWIWEHVYAAEDAFLDLMKSARRQQDPLTRRLLEQLARELLLLESSDWPFLITTVSARDYSEARVQLHLETFKRLLDMARRAEGGPLPANELAWLTDVESRDGPFPDIDLRWWTDTG